ncbi:hypothetical protein A3C19_02195 [Candidatus Kaiserbacteria bacterium RIFCSPHIGHO2_02_FULL_54_22]|uniref:Uncharacterized protein n=1 Tax=Candidatus Kaiserbacteria bacterium RIFCSPHIGHO2_02_FULL_54_22 TaxID=1798495 RepID=A0A1F6DNP8_9BACT|nr:MAG: hypothetical protein A3C19_02195 [Candidatus Kaiserbacteria bacterium RIFCSPHIGHO2_02_FULL_54_22]OGG68038.1 MAG: hypothetical protein A3E99_02030 [Candidatus Kaiserbacteria bacterium RIFCSPHIGHO2_12_FULL_54_16]
MKISAFPINEDMGNFPLSVPVTQIDEHQIIQQQIFAPHCYVGKSEGRAVTKFNVQTVARR